MKQYSPELIGSNFGFDNYSLHYFLEGMSALGLTTIEFWAIASHFDFLGADKTACDELFVRLEDAGVNVHCLTLEQVIYPVNIASPNVRMRQRSVEIFKQVADVAEELGAPLMFLTTGRGLMDTARKVTWERSVQGVREVVNYAASRGVTCVLEPLQPHESDLVNSLSDLVMFLSDVDDDRLKVVLDTVAMATAGDTVDEYFNTFGERIGHVQFVDGTPGGHLAWGEGNLPLADYARTIRNFGYRGKVSFEVFGPSSFRQDPVAGLRDCLASYTAAVELEAEPPPA